MTKGMRFRGEIRGVLGCARWPARQLVSSPQSAIHATYKRVATVSADGNLGLVRVDKDLGVPSWPTTTIACHNAVMCPPHGLLVNVLHRRVRLGLLPGELLVSTRLLSKPCSSPRVVIPEG